MLIQPDKWKLGDGLLSAEENLKKKYEHTDSSLNQFRFSDHEDMKNVELRIGTPMLHQDLIFKISKMNPSVWVEDSNANPTTVVGFYYLSTTGQKACAVCFDNGVLPEYIIVRADTEDLYTKEIRGWRTVLHRMLKVSVRPRPRHVLGAPMGLQALWRFFATNVKIS